MLRASISLSALGLLAMMLGYYQVAGVSMELGRLLLFIFLGLSIVAFLGGILTARNATPPR
jgi:hypothetical protein